jgi:glycosyltransferase involved in cell wall biosynthesis
MSADASVIVRAKNEGATIGRTLGALRSQTVRPEIVVVDSGSIDGTLEIARDQADQLIEMPEREFTFGRALNIGAGSSSAPFLFALSAHCVPPGADWIERSLALYERDDVVATNGGTRLPDGTPIEGTFYQDEDFMRAHPAWGFSNHASSWRRSAWERFPFDESLEAGEDKEWALRVLDGTGWVIGYRADLMVAMDHRWRAGARAYFRRNRKEMRALTRIAKLPRYRGRDLARDWWRDLPDDRHAAFAHRFMNYVRLAGLLGRYWGSRDARTASRPGHG